MSSIQLIKGSSVEQDVDVIVNAANKYLMAGSGVCGAIFKKAGIQQLTDSCNQYKTPLNDGDAVITPAFNISNAKYIIHAVGPNFSINPNADQELINAYYNSLILTKKHNLHTISFPLISSGIFGGLKENPALNSYRSCKQAYNKFINEYKDYDIDVKICAFNEREYNSIVE